MVSWVRPGFLGTEPYFNRVYAKPIRLVILLYIHYASILIAVVL